MGFAVKGLQRAYKSEANFRIQSALGVLAIGTFAYFRAEPHWWALMFLSCGGVLGSELVNTALEYALDHLHPEIHEAVGAAKDCAAASVLVFSGVSVLVAGAFLSTRLCG